MAPLQGVPRNDLSVSEVTSAALPAGSYWSQRGLTDYCFLRWGQQWDGSSRGAAVRRGATAHATVWTGAARRRGKVAPASRRVGVASRGVAGPAWPRYSPVQAALGRNRARKWRRGWHWFTG